MNCNKIEELYIDFILDLIGPNAEREKDRNINLELVSNIIKGILNKKYPQLVTHIFHYGSFPMKAYLKNADIDITIFLQSKEDKKIIKEIPIELLIWLRCPFRKIIFHQLLIETHKNLMTLTGISLLYLDHLLAKGLEVLEHCLVYQDISIGQIEDSHITDLAGLKEAI